jgi:hypothetical protein
MQSDIGEFALDRKSKGLFTFTFALVAVSAILPILSPIRCHSAFFFTDLSSRGFRDDSPESRPAASGKTLISSSQASGERPSLPLLERDPSPPSASRESL